jgi:hypothetical protein
LTTAAEYRGCDHIRSRAEQHRWIFLLSIFDAADILADRGHLTGSRDSMVGARGS